MSEGRYSVKSRKSVTVACLSGSVGRSRDSMPLFRFAIDCRASAILPLRLELGLVDSRGISFDSTGAIAEGELAPSSDGLELSI